MGCHVALVYVVKIPGPGLSQVVKKGQEEKALHIDTLAGAAKDVGDGRGAEAVFGHVLMAPAQKLVAGPGGALQSASLKKKISQAAHGFSLEGLEGKVS